MTILNGVQEHGHVHILLSEIEREELFSMINNNNFHLSRLDWIHPGKTVTSRVWFKSNIIKGKILHALETKEVLKLEKTIS